MPHPLRVLMAAATIVAAAHAVRAFGDSQLEVANETLVKGSLRPITESERISFVAPADAAISVRCTGRAGFLPRVDLFAPDSLPVRGTEKNANATVELTAPSTGDHQIYVTSRDGQEGEYSLMVRWTPRSRYVGPGVPSDSDRAFEFSAEAGSRASISVKKAPGASPFEPALKSLTHPGDAGAVPLTGRSAGSVALGETGTYTLLVDDGPADSEVVITVRIQSPKSRRRTVDVSGAVIGNGGAFVPGDFVVSQVLAGDGGLVSVDVPTNLGGGAFDLTGTSVLIPPGAFPTATTVVVGSSKKVRENKGSRNVGATVHFAPEGKNFGTPDAPQKALVTIPVTQTVLPGDTSRIRVTTRDERGRVTDVVFTQEERDAGFPDFTSRPGFVTFPVSHFSSYATTVGKLVPEDGVDNLQYGGAMVSDSVSMLVTARGAVYLYEIDDGEVTFDTKLEGSDVDVQDEFGSAVAVDGDIALVGAPHPFMDTESRAAAYVFRRARGVWSEQVKLGTPPNFSSHFGAAVAVAGDQLLISSWPNSKVTVYEESEGEWTAGQVIVAGDDLGKSSSSAFGLAVAVDGNTMVIAAPYRDSRRGAAYVFTRSKGTWTERALLTVEGDPNDTLGRSAVPAAVISGDTIVLGSGAGLAYVFRGSDDAWTLEQAIGREDGDLVGFGSIVGVSGDRLLIGAIDGDTNSGAVYFYRRSDSTWTRDDGFVPPIHRPGDFFGSSPIFIGENLAAVGANYDIVESTRTRSGSVYLFELEVK